MNPIDAILFQATLAPNTLALVAAASVVPYGRLAQGIISAERRLSAIGLKEGDIVALNIAHPIDHLVFACALYRSRITAVHLRPDDGAFDHLEMTAILYDSPNAMLAARHPLARVIIVNGSWFQDKVEITIRERSGAAREQAYPCRIVSDLNGGTLTLDSDVVAVQTKACSLAAPADWARMIVVMPFPSASSLSHAMLALTHGRTVCFSDVMDLRQIAAAYAHHYIVAGLAETRALIELQEKEFVSLPALRGLLVETDQKIPADELMKFAALAPNARCAYAHPATGIVAFADMNQIRNAAGGSIGHILPWAELRVDGVEQGSEYGDLKIRLRTQPGTGDWIDVKRKARVDDRILALH